MKALKLTGKFLLFFFAIGVGLFSLRYLSFEVTDILFAREEALQNLSYYLGFYSHVFFGPIALIIGPFQFLPKFRAKNLSLHRTLGKIYVVCCLLGGVAGFMIAFFTFGGWVTSLGFILLATFWIYSTLQAYLTIKKKQIEKHQIWMLRSYALTLSAVTLRLWNPVLTGVMGFDFLTAYDIVAWLCWVPNLAVVEWYIRRYLLNNPAVETETVFETKNSPS